MSDDAVRVDGFSPDGHYAATLSEGTPFPAAFLGEDRVLVRETDALDVDHLAVLKIHMDNSR